MNILTKIKAALTIECIMQKTKLWPESLVPSPYINLLRKLTSQTINIPGDILEVGVYKGGSLFRIARHIHKKHSKEFLHKHLIGIDTFEGHPYINKDKDPAHHYKGLFNDTSYESVCHFLSPFKFVKVFKGECQNIFNELPENQQFSLVNIDVDIYESYVRCIEYIYPRLSPGGIMICDEYEGYGHKKFIDEYFKDKPVQIRSRVGLNDGKNYGIMIYNDT